MRGFDAFAEGGAGEGGEGAHGDGVLLFACWGGWASARALDCGHVCPGTLLCGEDEASVDVVVCGKGCYGFWGGDTECGVDG